MRLILQRVSRAEVRLRPPTPDPATSPGAEGATHPAGPPSLGRIGRGVLVLLGVERGDLPAHAEDAAEKVAGLRLFDDPAGRLNLDVRAVAGAFLVVSQFTLAGTPLSRGRRPSFDAAAPLDEAEPLVNRFVERLRELGHRVETGRFRAAMEIELVNDGPATFVLDVPPRRGPS